METLSSYKQFAKHIVLEDDKSDKYTHIGYGKYKEKGKEDDKDAQTFKKDDSGKFSPVGGEKGGEEVPDSQKISGAGEFERPKATKQDVDSDMYAQDTWDRYGDEEESVTPIDNDKGVKRMAASIEKKTNVSPGSLELQGRTNANDGTLIIQWKDKSDGTLMGISDDGSVYEDGKKTSYKADQDSSSVKKRPLGGREAEAAYHKADMMMKKYAGVDIKRAEYWAKEKKKAADAMLPEHAFSEMFKRIGGR